MNKRARRKRVFTRPGFKCRVVRIIVELNTRQLIGGYATSGTRNAIEDPAMLHLKI